MVEAESGEAVRLRSKASEILQSPSSIALPASQEHMSSSIVTKSLAEMANADPIKLQNQSCVIREEIVKTVAGERPVYSSSAHLPTFSIGLCSTQGEAPPPAPPCESRVDSKEKSPHRYFQMPELGARIFVGDGGGFDTVACHLFDDSHHDLKSDLDSEYATIRSLYEENRPSRLNDWLQAHHVERKAYSEVILSGTELFVGPPIRGHGGTTVGNLRGMGLRESSSDYKDYASDETIRKLFDIVEQLGDPTRRVHLYRGIHRESVKAPDSWRSTKGSYLEKPKFMKWDDQDSKYNPSKKGEVLQLTWFDDFVILGNIFFNYVLLPCEAIDIVRKNASETVDVIATQLVKGVIEKIRTSVPYPITAIVIFLDHKEITRDKKDQIMKRKQRKDKFASSIPLMILGRGIIFKILGVLGILGVWGVWGVWGLFLVSKGVEFWKASRASESWIVWGVFALWVILVTMVMLSLFRLLHSVTMVTLSLFRLLHSEESIVIPRNEQFGMKSIATSTIIRSAKVNDDSEASSSVVEIEDDCKSQDVMVSRHITKWVIYRDLQERTLLCFFNIKEMLHEFYFEDHESMATIIGLGVPHSKVVLECGSPQVIVVEIPKEDWDVVWAHSNIIPRSISEDYVLKQERFIDILHYIANVINSDNITSKANDGDGGGDNGKGKAQGNGNDGKGKGKVDDNHGNSSHSNEGSNRPSDDDENKERKGKDENDDNKDSCDGSDGKTSNDCKEVKAVVHLHLLPGGVLEDKGNKKELAKVHEEEGEGKKKEPWEIQEEGEKNEGEARKGVEKNKKKNVVASWWHVLTGGENQQEMATAHGVENGDDVENLLKELENQIHSQMVFTFTYRYEATRPLKTIQATIKPITFQFHPSNEENYLRRRRFGWFHKKMQVAFRIVNTQAADLDANSCKVLDSIEAKQGNLQGNTKGNARTIINAYKGKMGIKYGVSASGEYDRTNGSESKTTEEAQNTWKTNKTITKVGFSILEHTDLNSQQLKYSYRPHFPFKEKEFEVMDEDDRLKMYENPICQLQRVSCEGTWQPYSENLEAYELEASRELGMTRIHDLKPEIGEEKKKKGVWKGLKNQPLYFIQKLSKVVYLNHAMSHLTSSKIEVHLREHRGDPFLTQAPNNTEPKWPCNIPLVDVKQNMNI